jgi:hypothetical protein
MKMISCYHDYIFLFLKTALTIGEGKGERGHRGSERELEGH